MADIMWEEKEKDNTIKELKKENKELKEEPLIK